MTVTAPTGYEVSLSSGSDYAPSLNITPASGVVNSKMIYIRLSASAGAGIYNGNITLDSAGATQRTLAVTGTVLAPEISLKQGAADIASGGSYNFGNVNIGSNSGAVLFTIGNTGTEDLILNGTPRVAISGSSDFSVDQSGVTSPIAASGSRNFTVTFTPSYTGAKNAVITIASNDRDESSYSVTLNGTGTAAPITAGVSMVSVSNVKATTAIAEAYSGESGATERGFYWWNDTQYWGDNASGLIPAGGSGAGVFSLTLSNLPAKHSFMSAPT
ncbi:MAG: choice-of-anchor D domain-containing protein [Desulfobacteraceae bacterium]|nr:choice-of-anchor D domain-containing protein [Desulfobacteraceae bacterium]